MEMTMSFKAHSLPADIDERKRIHAAFNEWVCQANDEDFLQLEQAREGHKHPYR